MPIESLLTTIFFLETKSLPPIPTKSSQVRPQSQASGQARLSLEPGPSRARYFPRDMLLLTTTARERAWRLLKIHSQFFDYVFLELSRAFTFV